MKQTSRDSGYTRARERRKALFSFCRRQGIRKLALAHNLDDVNETFLVNLLYTSSARTIVPAQPLFAGKLAIVRPLYYVDKGLARRYLKSTGYDPCATGVPSSVPARARPSAAS